MEGMLTVHIADRREVEQRFAFHVGERPVAGKDPHAPHSTRVKGRVFSSVCMLSVHWRTCATANSVRMGLPPARNAPPGCRRRVPAQEIRARVAAYTAPARHSSECGPVCPRASTSAVTEKTMSVGILHSIPRNSHMPSSILRPHTPVTDRRFRPMVGILPARST
jgi:hypothetical protein